MSGPLPRVSRVYAWLLRRVHPDIDAPTAAEAAAVFDARRRDARRRSLGAWASVWMRELTALRQGLWHRLRPGRLLPLHRPRTLQSSRNIVPQIRS